MAKQRTFLWSMVALLLLYWAARLIALGAFPPFIDEAFHINFGRAVLDSGLFAHAEEGRQFVVWLYILFGAPINAPFWSARTANLIALLPGFAAVIGAAKLLSNRWGAVFAGVLLIFSPYHHFFERLALADPVSASALALALYFAVRLHRRVAHVDAVLCGLVLFIACGAKISALPFFCIPVIAVLAFQRSRAGIRWAATALTIGVALTGAYLAVLFWRGHDAFFYLETGTNASRGEVVLTNIGHTLNTLIGYFGLPTAILLLLMLLILIIRKRFFLPLCLLLPLAVFWLSPRQDSRHLIAPMTILLLSGGVGLGLLVGRYCQLRTLTLGLLIVGGLLIWSPFALTAANAPSNLVLPTGDHNEYMASEGSGFGLSDVIATLRDRSPTRVIGILANCLSLRDLAPFPVECPHLNPNGEDKQALETLLSTSRAKGVYAVLESIPYAPSSAPGTVVATINIGRPRLAIYDLAP